MQVDDAFVRDVQSKLKAYANREEVASYIAATLAVAAERGLVVPDGVEWMDAVRTEGGNLLLRFSHYWPLPGEKLVRVALVEIKE